MIRKIISGGQTGADRAGLDFAIETGLEHGGYVPKAAMGRMRFVAMDSRDTFYLANAILFYRPLDDVLGPKVVYGPPIAYACCSRLLHSCPHF